MLQFLYFYWQMFYFRLEKTDGMDLFRKLLSEHEYSNLALQSAALTLLEKMIGEKLNQSEKPDAEPTATDAEDSQKKPGTVKWT